MDFYIGQIILFAGKFAPEGFLICDGRLLPINRYQALYAIIGVTYGGDSHTNFNLPDLRGRFPRGAQLAKAPGKATGADTVGIETKHLPAHSHDGVTITAPANAEVTVKVPEFTPTVSIATYDDGGTKAPPGNNYLASGRSSTGANAATWGFLSPGEIVGKTAGKLGGVAAAKVGPLEAKGTAQLSQLQCSGITATTGQGIALPIAPPALEMNYIIAFEGLFPIDPE